MTSDLYAVVEHRQWSGPSDSNITFRDSLAEAVELADELTADDATAPRPRTFHVYRLDEVDESELYDWASRSPDGQISVGTFESQIRACCPAGHTVVRRRLGTTNWTLAPEEGENR